MKNILLILVFICIQLTLLGQSSNDSTRILRGFVYTDEDEKYVGLAVYEYGSLNLATTQLNGGFELEIPRESEILLSIPFCFEEYFRVIKPDENDLIISLTRGAFRKSKKVFQRWQREQDKAPGKK